MEWPKVFRSEVIDEFSNSGVVEDNVLRISNRAKVCSMVAYFGNVCIPYTCINTVAPVHAEDDVNTGDFEGKLS